MSTTIRNVFSWFGLVLLTATGSQAQVFVMEQFKSEGDSGTHGTTVSGTEGTAIKPEIPLYRSPSFLGSQSSTSDLKGNFFQRLGSFYMRDWKGTLPATPVPARRALDAPLDSAPFPSADWGYGGSPIIGAPDGNVYPLMNAFKLQNARTKVYGWVAPSFDLSTSGNDNFPVSYDIFRTGSS